MEYIYNVTYNIEFFQAMLCWYTCMCIKMFV